MLINWFTVIAQLINFLILVWLLKRFLYEPVLHAIDAREKLISDQLSEAEAQKTESQKEREEFLLKNTEFDAQRSTLLSNAQKEVKAEALQLLEQSKREIQVMRIKWQESLSLDAFNLNDAISHRMQRQVFDITRKTLMDLSGISLEARMTEIFIQKLSSLNKNEKLQLLSPQNSSSNTLTIRSVFDLSQEQRSSVEAVLKNTFKADIQIEFEINPDLISGIELFSDGYKVSWNISNYMINLENSIAELIQNQYSPSFIASESTKQEDSAHG